MKKNNIKLLLLLCFLFSVGSIIINSCQKDPISEKTTVKSDAYFVNSQTASNYSEKVICSTVFQSLQSSSLNSKTTPKIIKNLKTILDINNLAAYYMINYEEGGFVIFSADKRITPILAYSEDGCLPYGNEEIPEALEDWLSSVKENIESVRRSNETPTQETQLQWKNFENEGNSNLVLKSATPPPNPCTGTFEQKGPLLPKELMWHQGCGFNQQLRLQGSVGACIGNAPFPCGRAYTGCTAIAMAQVMKYNQRPISYDWTQFPNKMPHIAPFPTEPGRLIAAIDAEDALNPAFTCTGTSGNLSSAASVLKNKFGYSSATYSSYNFSTVKSNLRANHPVLLSGGSLTDGHAWVCDGFQESKICMYNDDGSYNGACTYLFLYMKWGWEGSGDAWYAFDNFNPTSQNITYNFNSNRGMVYNIIP